MMDAIRERRVFLGEHKLGVLVFDQEPGGLVARLQRIVSTPFLNHSDAPFEGAEASRLLGDLRQTQFDSCPRRIQV